MEIINESSIIIPI